MFFLKDEVIKETLDWNEERFSTLSGIAKYANARLAELTSGKKEM